MLWIISGPSSVGKSTFLSAPRCAALTGLPPGSPIVWTTSTIDWDVFGSTDAFFHYNILRESARGVAGFDHHPPWVNIVKQDIPKHAVVLVASKETLIQRMSQRRIIEDRRIPGRADIAYPVASWLACLARVDLAALYAAWFQELRKHGIPYLIVNSQASSYRVIRDETAVPSLVNARRAYVRKSEDGGGNAGLASTPLQRDTPA